jgi:Cdc6-like AAA superfamily ATPase
LSRRFDPSRAFVFEDYNDEQLLNIMARRCVQKGVIIYFKIFRGFLL